MKDEKSGSFDVEAVRRDFPILSTAMNGKPLVYLDNGATTQKPRAVIDRIVRYYESENANIHRGVYQLSQKATDAYEEARKTVARFIHARDPKEIIFVRGTTEGVNLVASSWARANIKSGDQIVVSTLEHHSDIVPWQIVCEANGGALKVIPITDSGELVMEEYEKLLAGGRVKLVALTHLSNALGTINDVKRIAELAHRAGAKVLIDGAQWVAHYPTDVQEIGCDFYTFSGHKLYGPTGIGVLYGRQELLEAMPPFHGGGDMIETVTFEKTTYASLPNKFEAGTPDIAGVLGLAAAIEYVESIGFEKLIAHEHDLLDHATIELNKVSGLRIVGTAKQKGGVISFVLEKPEVASLDAGMKLDAAGIAVRTGHHCGMPLMNRLGIPGTIRATFAMYNTSAEVDALAATLQKIVADAKPTTRPAATELVFPAPSGPSPQTVADELAEVFEILGERDARNDQVLDFGNALPNYFNTLKHLTQRVPGCMSEVYIVSRKVPGTDDRFEFIADADAHIVRGEIAMLQRLYSGQRAKDVLDFDYEAFFRRIGLDQFLSSQRRNGLAGMVKRIRNDASAIVKG